jgi:hypothetical protein
MAFEDDIPLVELIHSSFDIETVVASFEEDVDIKNNARTALVLFVPEDLSPEYEGPAFPLHTGEIFRYFRASCAEIGNVEIAVREDEFKEFDYRFDSQIFPTLWISSHIFLPLAVNLLSSYIQKKLSNVLGEVRPVSVKAKVHFPDSCGDVSAFKYEGPASTFEKVAADYLREVGIWLEREQLDEEES